MPVSTGNRYAGADAVSTRDLVAGGLSPVAWTNPQRARQSEPDEGLYAHNAAATAGSPTETHRWTNFSLLAEEGGSIPAGAIITSIVFEWRLQVANATGATDTFRVRARYGLDSPFGTGILSAGPVLGATAARATSAWTTFTQSYLGSIANPQATWTRAMLANGQLAMLVQGDTEGTGLGNSQVRVAWLRVTAEWALVVNKAGGAVATGVASATKKVEKAAAGGGAASAAAGGTKTAETQRAGGSAAVGVGGGSRKTEATKAGGSSAAAVGGGAKKIEKVTTGGAAAMLRGGGARVVDVVRAGGAAAVARAGATKRVEVVRAGGSSASGVGGGVGRAAVVKTGGSVAALAAGATKAIVKAVAGGGRGVLSAGGVQVVAVVRSGGAAAAGAGGAAKAVVVVRVGGAAGVAEGGGSKRVDVVKLGGAVAELLAGGARVIDVAKLGGAVLAGEGGAVQYSVYTFAIGGVSRDNVGNVLPMSKMGLLRVTAGGYEFVAQVVSDALDGEFVFRTPSPDVDPRPYTITLHRDHPDGNYDGKSDEDLVPEPQLVQGGEL